MCSFDECSDPVSARGLCRNHYNAAYVKGEYRNYPNSRNQNNRRAVGTRITYSDGYVSLKLESGLVLEHRHVMEGMLGRPLTKNETVHHINGVRSDNRPENLELWRKAQPSGQRVTELIDYVVEFHGAEAIRRLRARGV